MEALRVLAIASIFAVVFAGVITLIASLAMEPLERARQRYVERERRAVKALRV
jgi:TctA family transporter